MRLFDTLLRRLLSDAILDGPADQARQAKVVVGFSFLIAIWGPIYYLVFSWFQLDASALSTPIAAAMMVATATVLRRSGSIRVAGNWLAFALFFIVCVVALETGGYRSSALQWFLIIPALAAVGASRRDAIAWVAVVVGTTALLAALDAWVPASSLPEELEAVFNVALGIGAASVIASVAIYAETQRRWSHRIGEEQRARADAAREAARRILDNVHEGFVVVDAAGRLQPGHSAVAERWLGPAPEGGTLADWVGARDASVGLRMAMEWDQLAEGWLPLDVVLYQLPKELVVDGQTLALLYRPLLGDAGELTAMLVSVVDVSAEREAERVRALQSDVDRLLRTYGHDPNGVRGFLREGAELIEDIRSAEGPLLARALHTLKGNAGLYGLHHLASVVHDAESALMEQAAWDRDAVEAAWKEIYDRANVLVRLDAGSEVPVPRRELFRWHEQLAVPKPHPVRDHIHQHLTEPVELRLDHLGQGGVALAQRLGMGEIQLEVDGGALRLDPVDWAPLWLGLVHVVRNCVDHGLGGMTSDDPPTLTLRAAAHGDGWFVEVQDNGGGVDWERVAAAAARKGLPHDTHEDLVDALFHDGLTTREQATETSGRGVGMAAVRAVVRERGGTIGVHGAPGEGTRFRFCFPRRHVAHEQDHAEDSAA